MKATGESRVSGRVSAGVHRVICLRVPTPREKNTNERNTLLNFSKNRVRVTGEKNVRQWW